MYQNNFMWTSINSTVQTYMEIILVMSVLLYFTNQNVASVF